MASSTMFASITISHSFILFLASAGIDYFNWLLDELLRYGAKEVHCTIRLYNTSSRDCNVFFAIYVGNQEELLTYADEECNYQSSRHNSFTLTCPWWVHV